MINLYLAESTQPASNMFIIMIPFLILLGFSAFMGRSNRKKEAQRTSMIDTLKVGDEVVTIGGFYGKIDRVGDDFFIIKFQKGDAAAKIQKRAVSGLASQVAPTGQQQTSSKAAASTNDDELDDDNYAPLDDK